MWPGDGQLLEGGQLGDGLVGGFQAWRATGLTVTVPATPYRRAAGD
ncbi:hypothetical protein [Streptomyces sp. BBFR102]